MIVLLVGELSILSAYQPEARLFVYSFLNLPILKILASFTGLAIAAISITGSFELPETKLNRSFVLLHLCCTVLLVLSLAPFYRATLTLPAHKALPGWLGLGLLFLGSWALALLPVSQWRRLANQYWKELVASAALAIVIPYLADLAEAVWETRMRSASFELSSFLLSLMFQDRIVMPEEKILGVPEFQIYIASSCSGYEGIALIGIFLSVYLFLKKADLRFPQALLILPVGIVASWLANGVRLASLIAVGALLSTDIANGAFHSNAGWVLFVLLGLLFLFVLERFEVFHKEKSEKRNAVAPEQVPSYPAYLSPLAVQLSLTLVFSSVLLSVDVFYPTRMLIVAAVLWGFQEQYSKLGIGAPPSVPAVGIGFLVYVLWIALVPQAEASKPYADLSGSVAASWICFRLLGSVIVVPIVEELAFRGYLLRRLQSPRFESVPQNSLTVASVLVSSLAFGFLHSAWIAGTVAGILYALTCKCRGRLNDAIWAHGITNFLVALHVVQFQRWDLW